ncbi:MAG: Hsp20/alpha crystallin family protein [Arenicellales bacterium]
MKDITQSSERRTPRGLFGDFDDIFDDFWRPVRRENGGAFAPAVDVRESDAEYRIRADLPGVEKDDLDISLQDGVLTINAETRQEKKEEKEGRVIRQERRCGKFVRSMRLGDTVDADKIKAEYKDGVLDLVLPKTEKVKVKKIDVQVK